GRRSRALAEAILRRPRQPDGNQWEPFHVLAMAPAHGPSRYCQVWSAWEADMGRSGIDVEYRIMPSGDGHWYWEIVADENEVLKRGVSDTADAAAEDAKAARA